MNSKLTKSEFYAALLPLTLAIQNTRDSRRKPKTYMNACEGYRKGTRGKRKHLQQLSQMTLEQLFHLAYEIASAEGS